MIRFCQKSMSSRVGTCILLLTSLICIIYEIVCYTYISGRIESAFVTITFGHNSYTRNIHYVRAFYIPPCGCFFFRDCSDRLLINLSFIIHSLPQLPLSSFLANIPIFRKKKERKIFIKKLIETKRMMCIYKFSSRFHIIYTEPSFFFYNSSRAFLFLLLLAPGFLKLLHTFLILKARTCKFFSPPRGKIN